MTLHSWHIMTKYRCVLFCLVVALYEPYSRQMGSIISGVYARLQCRSLGPFTQVSGSREDYR